MQMVFGITGFSGSGKTTLIEKLIPVFKSKGLKTAVIKHDGHDFDMDRDGKDTFRFRTVGADTVMISSNKRSALLSENERTLDEMIRDACERGADIILVEGYKHEDIPRLFVLTKRCGYTVPDDIEGCLAIATDDMERAEDTGIPVFDIDDAVAIGEWIMEEGNRFTHFDPEGNARMVDVSYKEITVRTAVATGRVIINRETFELISKGNIKKGDVLSVAQIAGIMGAKRTPDIIPMCHPVVTDSTKVKLRLNEEKCCIDIEAEVKCTGRTGVEMEAICACSVAAMTVYDMCKSVERDIVITDIKLKSKTGGIHGDYMIDQDQGGQI